MSNNNNMNKQRGSVSVGVRSTFSRATKVVSDTSVAIPLKTPLILKKSASFTYNRVGAAIIGTFMLLAFIPAVVATRATLGKGILYWDTRSGPNGSFNVPKLRTMKNLTQGQERYKDDSKRVTKLGKILRKLRIDEVPQLFYNIFWKGNMNLVGPRPQPATDEYQVPNEYAQLTKYTPGLFTPKQLAAPDIVRSTPEEENFIKRYAEGCRIELEYMQNRKLFSDTNIIARVAYKMIFQSIAANPKKKKASVTEISSQADSRPKGPLQTQQSVQKKQHKIV